MCLKSKTEDKTGKLTFKERCWLNAYRVHSNYEITQHSHKVYERGKKYIYITGGWF